MLTCFLSPVHLPYAAKSGLVSNHYSWKCSIMNCCNVCITTHHFIILSLLRSAESQLSRQLLIL